VEAFAPRLTFYLKRLKIKDVNFFPIFMLIRNVYSV